MAKRVEVSTLRVTLNDRRAEAEEINDLISQTQKQLQLSTKQVSQTIHCCIILLCVEWCVLRVVGNRGSSSGGQTTSAA
jgi:hypothetical protein